MRLTFWISTGVILTLLVGLWWGRERIPDRWNPWAPLDVDEPLGWLTRYKLSRLSHDPGLCLSVLTRANVRYTPVADRETSLGGGFENAVRVESTPIRSVEPFTLSCRSTVSRTRSWTASSSMSSTQPKMFCWVRPQYYAERP